jgi:hypothetical protein
MLMLRTYPNLVDSFSYYEKAGIYHRLSQELQTLLAYSCSYLEKAKIHQRLCQKPYPDFKWLRFITPMSKTST